MCLKLQHFSSRVAQLAVLPYESLSNKLHVQNLTRKWREKVLVSQGR